MKALRKLINAIAPRRVIFPREGVAFEIYQDPTQGMRWFARMKVDGETEWTSRACYTDWQARQCVQRLEGWNRARVETIGFDPPLDAPPAQPKPAEPREGELGAVFEGREKVTPIAPAQERKARKGQTPARKK